MLQELAASLCPTTDFLLGNATGTWSFATSINSTPTFLGFSDGQWVGIAPGVGYWVVSGFYEALDALGWCQQYKIQPSPEEQKRNVAKRSDVLKHVIGLHCSQIVMGFIVSYLTHPTPAADGSFGSLDYFKTQTGNADALKSKFAQYFVAYVARTAYLIARQLISVFILDTWVFWGHFAEHKIPWLYRKSDCAWIDSPC
jgi:sphinganine C4-monooxygenase